MLMLTKMHTAIVASKAIFTAPRARNERGHFISAKGAQA